MKLTITPNMFWTDCCSARSQIIRDRAAAYIRPAQISRPRTRVRYFRETRGNDLLSHRDANVAEPEGGLSANFGLDLISGKRFLVPPPDKIARFHGAERRFGKRGLFIAHPPLVGSRAALRQRWRLAIRDRNIRPDGRRPRHYREAEQAPGPPALA
jgi:hypothetical protein